MAKIESIDFSRFDQKTAAIFDRIGEIVKIEMIDRCPKEYGTMVASIEAEKTGDTEITIGTHGIPYAGYVEYGTGPMIRAHGEHIVENPVTDWKALRKRNDVGTGQTMPFARTAAFFKEEDILKTWKEAFR